MAKLKRVLAGALSLCMVGSMLTACGDSSSSSDTKSSSKKDSSAAASSSADSSTADSSTADSSEAPKAERKNTAELKGKESSDKSKNTLRIYCFNTEFKKRFDELYPISGQYKDKLETEEYEDKDDGKLTQIKKMNGVEVEWVQIENKDNAYQNALDEALKGQKDSDNKVDMFLIEADYAIKYTDSKDTDYTGLVALTPSDIGVTDEDMSQMYEYTKDAVRDPISGDIKAVSWQATPGLLYYDVKMAKEVLGTDEPDKVQEFVKDWASFKDTAKKMKDKGYMMLSSFADTFRVFGANVSQPWVSDGKLNLDPQMKEWIDMTKEFTDAGYINKTNQWEDPWYADMGKDGKVFCFFMPSWGIDACLKKGKDSTGKFKACVGPAGWFWGGTWIAGAVDSDNQDLVADIMKTMTCDKAVADAFIKNHAEMVNNKAAIADAKDSYKNDFLGGQNHLVLMAESAEKINIKGKISAYDQACVEKLQSAMGEYFKGTSDYDKCLEAWKKEIKAKYADIDVGL